MRAFNTVDSPWTKRIVNPLIHTVPHLCQDGKGCGHSFVAVEGHALLGPHPLSVSLNTLEDVYYWKVFSPNFTLSMELQCSFSS